MGRGRGPGCGLQGEAGQVRLPHGALGVPPVACTPWDQGRPSFHCIFSPGEAGCCIRGRGAPTSLQECPSSTPS